MIATVATAASRLYVFKSELGWMALEEGSRGVSQFTFAHRSPAAALAAIGINPSEDLALRSAGPLVQRLQAFARGRYDDFLDVPLCLGKQTEFQQRVTAACRSILPGRTASYGELAAAVGAPRAARAVGSVMAANRIPLLVPCHRVLRAGGQLGGYSMGRGLALKQQLIELERSMAPASRARRFGAKAVAITG